jgi:hypothetical protein
MNFEFDYTELSIKRDSKILIQTLLAFRKHYSEEKKKALAIYEKEEFSPRLGEKKKHNQSLQVIGEEESIEVENREEVSIKSIEEKEIFFGENNDAFNNEIFETKEINIEAGEEENVESEHSDALSKKSMGTKKVIFQEENDDEEDKDEEDEKNNDALSKKSGENYYITAEEEEGEYDDQYEEEENLEGEHIDAISKKVVIFEEESEENNHELNKESVPTEEEIIEEEQEDEYEYVTDEEDEDEERENLEENIDKHSKNSVENKKLIFGEEEKIKKDNSLSKDSDEGEVYEECLQNNNESRKATGDGIKKEISINRNIRNQLIDINKKLDKQKEINFGTNLYINYKTKPSVYRINEANGQLEALFENDLLTIQEENETDAEDSFITIKSKNSDDSDPELKFNELNTSLSAPESTEFENINNDLKNSPEKNNNSSSKYSNNRSVVFKMKTHVIF